MKLLDVAKEIAICHNTPFYIYNENKIVSRINRMQSAFNASYYDILYAMKANANPYIIKLISSYGIGIDACSTEEIEIAIRCGLEPAKIHYNADCVKRDELKFAFNKKVHITLGSLDTLEELDTVANGQEITLRINTGVGSGHSIKVVTNGEMSKFGILPSELDDALRICNAKKIRVSGLHSHTGSGEMTTNSFIDNAAFLADLSMKLNGLSHLNFGGGFGYDYVTHNEYDLHTISVALNLLRSKMNLSEHLRFIIEPGRYFVADSGKLIATVCSVKKLPHRNYIGLDTGYNHFPRCFYYNAWHDIENITSPYQETESYDVVGNLCQSGDVFARDRALTKTQKGDLLSINDVGAYGYSMSSNFNLRQRPAEYIIRRDGSYKTIRRAENFDDIYSTCIWN
ncbi:diaminopimelate decarboxylase|uniref:Diaminopimelate decarboxylase n=1 Tax=Brenneria salicis ATCC 15712 = DSM 30166 TaxID=714314 RepID=A0A366HZG2_9GAMM|nr:diaminopimelate decarboxylase [Brenneria salicis]NMN90401.1 diaminopimelate decarboxylase [Brenneria salicis ATCC 15712 = DSM 30166]RBP57853.1 diaminopimelate decarboxylase [Brenneria salicis ATCC 15712 = DSM 30166]RLM28908.1 diaminopimelate decarboxylase [Brenneria salicis ATCC 15712 = DSM 30166]